MGPHPDIGTAWLLLSHGPFLACSMTATAIAISLLIFAYTRTNCHHQKEFQRLAITWNIASSVVSLWTIYAIMKTWQSAEDWPQKVRIFDDFGFGFLSFVALLIALFNLFILQSSLHIHPERPLQEPLLQATS